MCSLIAHFILGSISLTSPASMGGHSNYLLKLMNFISWSQFSLISSRCFLSMLYFPPVYFCRNSSYFDSAWRERSNCGVPFTLTFENPLLPEHLVMLNIFVFVFMNPLEFSMGSFFENICLFFYLASMATSRDCLVNLYSSSMLSLSSPSMFFFSSGVIE